MFSSSTFCIAVIFTSSLSSSLFYPTTVDLLTWVSLKSIVWDRACTHCGWAVVWLSCRGVLAPMCQDARPRWAQAKGWRNRIPHLDGARRGLLPSTSEGYQMGVGRCPAVLARSGERAGVMDMEATRRPGTQRCQQALGRCHLGAEALPGSSTLQALRH